MKEKVNYLEDSSRRLHGLYDKSRENIQTLEGDKKVLQNQLNSEKAESDRLRDRIRKLENGNQGLNNQNQNFQSMQSKLNQCQSDNVKVMAMRNSCRGELFAVQRSERNLDQSLQSARRNIKTLNNEKELLENQLNSCSEQSRIQQLGNLPGSMYLWHGDFVNGQYVIAYAFDYGLNQNVKSMLPKVIIKIEIKSEICKELSKIYR